MSTQPTAIFLAEVMENDPASKMHHDRSAAELRRLHELALEQQGKIYALEMARSMEQKTANLKQAALLEALKRMASIIDKMGDMPDGFIHPSPWQTLKCEEALTQARAAISAVEGEKE